MMEHAKANSTLFKIKKVDFGILNLGHIILGKTAENTK